MTLILLLAAMAGASFYMGRRRSLAIVGGPAQSSRLHSLPGYYGYFTLISCLLPALGVFFFWVLLEPKVIVALIVESLPKEVELQSEQINGTAENELIMGFAGSDILNGAAGDDTLDGGDDNDVLVGGFGSDSLFGGSGNDVLSGGAGHNILTGGEGNDIFKISRKNSNHRPFLFNNFIFILNSSIIKKIKI